MNSGENSLVKALEGRLRHGRSSVVSSRQPYRLIVGRGTSSSNLLLVHYWHPKATEE